MSSLSRLSSSFQASFHILPESWAASLTSSYAISDTMPQTVLGSFHPFISWEGRNHRSSRFSFSLSVGENKKKIMSVEFRWWLSLYFYLILFYNCVFYTAIGVRDINGSGQQMFYLPWARKGMLLGQDQLYRQFLNISILIKFRFYKTKIVRLWSNSFHLNFSFSEDDLKYFCYNIKQSGTVNYALMCISILFKL